MAGAKGIRAGRAYVEIGASTDQLQKALNGAGKSLKDFGKRMAGIGAGLSRCQCRGAWPDRRCGFAFCCLG